VHAIKAYGANGGVVPLILNLALRGEWSATHPAPQYPPAAPKEAVWPAYIAWYCATSISLRVRDFVFGVETRS